MKKTIIYFAIITLISSTFVFQTHATNDCETPTNSETTDTNIDDLINMNAQDIIEGNETEQSTEDDSDENVDSTILDAKENSEVDGGQDGFAKEGDIDNDQPEDIDSEKNGNLDELDVNIDEEKNKNETNDSPKERCEDKMQENVTEQDIKKQEINFNDESAKKISEFSSLPSTLNLTGASSNLSSMTNTIIETYAGSGNNYLSSLSVDGHEFTSEFSKDNSNYFLSLDEVTNLSVDAVAEDSNSTVKISGNDNLKDGINKILISVTAENNSTRYYRIYIIVDNTDNANPNKRRSQITSSGEIESALSDNLALHTTYILDESYVETNTAYSKGDKLLKYKNGEYLLAPYDCIVTGTNLPDNGETIRNSHYISIISTEELKMSFKIDESKISDINIGDSVTITVSALNNKEYSGNITKISNIASNGKFTVEVEFANDKEIRVGMSGELKI